MELSELEKTVIEQAKIEAYRICKKHENLIDSVCEMGMLYDNKEDEHFLWFVDFFMRTYWNKCLVLSSFQSVETQKVYESINFNPRPPNNGQPSTEQTGGSR